MSAPEDYTEPHITKEIKEHLKPGDVFVDIGANL
jgi:hypothetical protein